MSQHRWEQWIESEEVKKVLRNARDRLKTAWGWDRKDPKSYPINTSYALAEIQESLSKQPRKKKIRVRLPKPKEPKAPKSLAELVREKLVKIIWEEHHSGTFRDALREAARVNYEELEKSWKAFQGIVRAMETAYMVDSLGLEMLPRPKVSILHRGLDRIARAAGLEGQTEGGFAEFLDDLCPCGIKRHKDAVRKLSSRSPRMRRPPA